MNKKLNADQKIVMRLAKEELFRGNRVTISAKKFGHLRKFKDEVDVVSSPYLLKEVKKDG